MWDKRKGSLSGAFFNFGEWLVNVGFLCCESANAYTFITILSYFNDPIHFAFYQMLLKQIYSYLFSASDDQ